ncbi:MAG: NUMOD3 domain-containing DNA-binding protein [Opitutaceae bacterium]
MNKYKNWYDSIIATATHRILITYTEKHHIIPRSLGGDDSSANLVNLTAREHFICHWLLTKIHIGEAKHKMLHALRMLRAEKIGQARYKTKITARVYANLKEEYALLQSDKLTGSGNGFYGKHHTVEAKELIRQKNLGNKITNEQRQKIVLSKVGKKRAPFSEEWIANITEARQGERNGMYGKIHSDETKAKQRERAIGRKQSAETIAKKADANRGKTREKLLCPHCSKLVAVNTYPRWHGDNCKLNN